jgi:hypothetical protein
LIIFFSCTPSLLFFNILNTNNNNINYILIYFYNKSLKKNLITFNYKNKIEKHAIVFIIFSRLLDLTSVKKILFFIKNFNVNVTSMQARYGNWTKSVRVSNSKYKIKQLKIIIIEINQSLYKYLINASLFYPLILLLVIIFFQIQILFILFILFFILP